MLKSLLPFFCLATLPTLSFAQSGPASGFYLGISTSLLTNRPFNQNDAAALVGPALTGGFQFTPHVALQLGAAYAWRNTSTAFTYYDYGSTILSVNSTDTQLRVYTFPLLVRATLTSPASRVHADVVGGLLFLHSTSQQRYTSTLSGRVMRQDESAFTTNRANVTLGPAVRYAFTPRWEVAANALVNYYFSDVVTPSFSDHLFLNALVGVQYSFGQE